MTPRVRKILLLSCTALALLGAPYAAVSGTFNAQGQFSGTVSPQVIRTISAFPSGGPALTAAIALLLENDPRLADDVVYAARSANEAQKRAIGRGIAQAARFFALCRSVPTETCRAAEAALRYVMLFADPLTQTAYNESNGATASADTAGMPPVFIPGVGTQSCGQVTSNSFPNPLPC